MGTGVEVFRKSFFLMLLVCCGNSVKLEDGIESSGAGEVIITPDLSGVFSSGDEGTESTSGAGIDTGTLSDIAEQELNATFKYSQIVPNAVNKGSMNDTLGIELSNTTTKIQETPSPSSNLEMATATPSTTTLGERTSADKMAEMTLTAASLVMDTTPPETTIETESTPTAPPTTTTNGTSINATGSSTQTALKPTLPAPVSTKPQTPFCEIDVDSDLNCTVELTCFGDGEIDCTEIGEKAAQVTTSVAPPSTDEDEDYYDESYVSSTEPTRQLGRWKKLSSRRHRFTSATTEATTLKGDSSATTARAILETLMEPATTTESIIRSWDTTFVASVTTTSTAKLEAEPETTKGRPLHVELPTTPTEVSFTENGSSVQALNSSSEMPELLNTALLGGNTGTMTESSSSSTGGFDSAESTEPSSRRRRSKRQEINAMSSSSALPSSQSRKRSSSQYMNEVRAKLCKIKGELICWPVPSREFCQGKGRCRDTFGETETDTSSAAAEDGIETWAIAVIAICSTAVCITIIFLVYLIVTSWKKLKVQPHSGVTTLTYVNNATP